MLVGPLAKNLALLSCHVEGQHVLLAARVNQSCRVSVGLRFGSDETQPDFIFLPERSLEGDIEFISDAPADLIDSFLVRFGDRGLEGDITCLQNTQRKTRNNVFGIEDSLGGSNFNILARIVNLSNFVVEFNMFFLFVENFVNETGSMGERELIIFGLEPNNVLRAQFSEFGSIDVFQVDEKPTSYQLLQRPLPLILLHYFLVGVLDRHVSSFVESSLDFLDHLFEEFSS